jgi:hypothetical protein
MARCRMASGLWAGMLSPWRVKACSDGQVVPSWAAAALMLHSRSARAKARSASARSTRKRLGCQPTPLPAGQGPTGRRRWRPKQRTATDGTEFFGPPRVRAATVKHGRQRSPTVTDGSDEPQVGDSPGPAVGDDAGGRFRLWSRWSGLTPRGSRRAATDRRRDQHYPWRTMTDRGRLRAPAAFRGSFLVSNLPAYRPVGARWI